MLTFLSSLKSSGCRPFPTGGAGGCLVAELESRADVFRRETDIVLKRNGSANMLEAVLRHLHALPPFADTKSIFPLKDMLMFFSDLERGRDHPWSLTVLRGGTNQATTAMTELKLWVLAVFAVLRSVQFTRVEAYRQIAEGLSKTGRSGRNGLPLRWRTVGAWCREAQCGSDAKITAKAQAWWTEYDERQAPLFPAQDRTIRAKRFADEMWQQEHPRDRSFSA